MAGVGDTRTIIKKVFEKGFLQDISRNKTADYFADYVRNVRSKNGGILVRDGYLKIYDGEATGEIQGITQGRWGELFVVHDQKLYEIDYTADPVTATDLGSIGTTGKVRFIPYGDFIIILVGNGFPYVWDGSTLTQLTSSNLTTGVNPQFGTRFAGFTAINSQLNTNVIYLSRPITVANQQYAYDRSGTDSETISYDSPVVGLIGTLNNLWIFTETAIERMDRSSVAVTGGVASLYSVPLSSGYQLAWPDAVVGAGDILFFLTKNKKIGTVNYIQGNVEPQLTIVSDKFGSSIDEFMQRELADDQSDATAVFDRRNNLVIWNVKGANSTVNNLRIIRDIQNQTRFVDDNYFVRAVTTLNDEIYYGSSLNFSVFQDGASNLDDGEAINRVFETTDFVFDPLRRPKQFVGTSLAGQVNNLTEIQRDVLVDGDIVASKTIAGGEIAPGQIDQGVGSQTIGGEPIGGDQTQLNGVLFDFEQVMDRGALRNTGKKLKMIFSGSKPWQDFVLDYLDITYRPRKRALISDKL